MKIKKNEPAGRAQSSVPQLFRDGCAGTKTGQIGLIFDENGEILKRLDLITKYLQNQKSATQVQSSRQNSSNLLPSNELEEFLLKNGTEAGQTSPHGGQPAAQIFSSLYDTLAELCKEKKMFFLKPTPFKDYTPPKLTQGKVWYISFYVTNPATNRLKRIRIKLNRIKPARERKRAAAQLMASIAEKLALGWNPLLCRSEPGKTISIEGGINAYLKAKGKELETASMQSYESYIRVFAEWMAEEGISVSAPVYTINKDVAGAFMRRLERDEKISARTYNNYLSFLVSLFSWFKDRDYVQENVFEGLPKKPKRLIKKKRRLFTSDELERLFSYLRRENPQYLAVTMLCYCCLMRPKEIALLKCGDINPEKQTVHVRSETAKNDRESYRTIPSEMMPAIAALDLKDPEAFLFGKNRGDMSNFSPGKSPVAKKKFSDYWNLTVRPALDFPMDLQLYSLKDTGITNMLSNGVPINLVQQQADHSSVAMTAIYVGKSERADSVLKEIELPH